MPKKKVGMLARVVCSLCHKDLRVKEIKSEILGIVVTVESCRDPNCQEPQIEDNPEYEKHLSDMFIQGTPLEGEE
jgi:hypothetical protein